MREMSRVYHLATEERGALAARLEAALADRSDVLFALAFGSFVDRDAFRDIDIGIWTAASARPDLDVRLSASLSRELGIPVDVRRLNEAPVPFLFHALRGRILAVRDEVRLADLMERTARDYHDRAPILRRAAAEAFAR
jgi:predicted nucleotidyltransferase